MTVVEFEQAKFTLIQALVSVGFRVKRISILWIGKD
jgi:hypothetical protein